MADEIQPEGQQVHLHVAVGWVVSTPATGGNPFVIGPFDDRDSMNIWRQNMEPNLTEEMTFHGETMIFYPDSYAEVTIAIKEQREQEPPDTA